LDNAIKNKDDSFKKKAISSTKGYVLFNNGYFSMKEHTFYTDNPPHLYFMEKIPFDYKESNPDYEKDIENRLFTEPFETIGDYYLLTLAIALAGETHKKFLVGIGFTNTGKSLLTGALHHTIGGYFSGWDAGNLLYKQTGQDSAQACRWMMLLQTKRIIMSNELKSTGALDANLMKSLSNGGNDPITGRFHGGNETQFHLSLLPILFANDLPEIRPVDDAILKRLITISYKKTYVDKDKIENKEYQLKIDPNIEDEIKTDEFRNSFLGLMFQRYYKYSQDGKYVEPEKMTEERKEIIGDDTDIIKSFLKDFEFSDNKDDYVPSSRITNWLKEGRKAVHITKFTSELKKYCAINNKYVANKDTKIGGRTMKCWYGLKESEDTPQASSAQASNAQASNAQASSAQAPIVK
jgi:phage/plasmid-associated DNA primase